MAGKESQDARVAAADRASAAAAAAGGRGDVPVLRGAARDGGHTEAGVVPHEGHGTPDGVPVAGERRADTTLTTVDVVDGGLRQAMLEPGWWFGW